VGKYAHISVKSKYFILRKNEITKKSQKLPAIQLGTRRIRGGRQSTSAVLAKLKCSVVNRFFKPTTCGFSWLDIKTRF
jgi:hypothetical protein